MKSLTLLTLCALVALAACFAHADSDDHSSESHHSDSHDHDSHDDHDDHDHDHDHDHDGHDDHSGHGGHGSHGAANMKGMSIAVITACAWIVDILVILIPGLSEKKFLISILTAFGGGVFAITGVSHLLAEAVDIMNARYHDHDVERFRPAYLAAVLGYFIMLLLQRGIFKEASHGSGDMNKGFEEEKTSSGSSSPTSEEKDEKNDGAVVPMGEETTQKKDEKKDTDGSPTTSGLIALAILFATLVIHRIVEGMALGLQESQEGVLVVFIAIIGHHWAMDLFFAFKTGRIPAEDGTAENPGSYFSTPVRIVLSFISSATTAIGIGIGWGLSSSIPSTAVAWLLAFSAGTFFFFGFSEVVVSEMPVGKRSLPQILAFFIGIAGMYGAVAGLYSEEAHNH